MLELSGNKIQKVDDSIGQLALLKELDLSGNEITTVSDALGTLPKLEVRARAPLRACAHVHMRMARPHRRA